MPEISREQATHIAFLLSSNDPKIHPENAKREILAAKDSVAMQRFMAELSYLMRDIEAEQGQVAA